MKIIFTLIAISSAAFVTADPYGASQANPYGGQVNQKT